jgi:Protein of unknown function (DUF998)
VKSQLAIHRAAGAALILAAVFPATVLALSLVQLRQHNPATDAISLPALARGGIALNVAFIAGGALMFTNAWVLHRSVRSAVAGPILLAAFGCTSTISGLVDTAPDNAPATAASQLHQLAGVLGFVCMTSAMYVFARRFRTDPAWHSFARPTLLWAIAATATLLGIFAAAPANLFGTAQALHIATWLSWTVATMRRVRRLTAPQPEPAPIGAANQPAIG